MDLEQQIKDLPKPLVATIAILIVIGALFILQPLHTVCDSQTEAIRSGQAGLLYPQKVSKKNGTIPGRIQNAMVSCRFGNSAGSCYDYFDLLKKAAQAVKNGSFECTAQIVSMKIDKYAKMEEYTTVRDGKSSRDELAGVVFKDVTLEEVLRDGLEMMIRKAWGESPPEPGAQRYGWFQESEINAFCHVRDVLIRAKGRDGFKQLTSKIATKLPGEAPPRDIAGEEVKNFIPREASRMMTEQQIFDRSLLSVPCDQFR